MGAHTGFRVREIGGAHLGQAWDPAAGKYKSKSFPRASLARKWAMDQAAVFRAKLESIAEAAGTPTQAVRDYVAELRRLGRNEVHCHDTERALLLFARHWQDIGHPRSRQIAREWLASDALEHLSPATRNRYLRVLRSLGTWLVDEGTLPSSPFAAIKEENEPNHLKPQFDLDEMTRMACADGHPYHLRACLLIYAGLRRNGAASLTWERINLQQVRLRVVEKGDKERLVPIQPELAALLTSARPEGGGEMFPDRHVNLGKEFDAFLADLAIPKADRTMHSLRHCYAGLMTATGAPSILLQYYMGHESVETTKDYATFASIFREQVKGWELGEFRLRSSPIRVRGAVSR